MTGHNALTTELERVRALIADENAESSAGPVLAHAGQVVETVAYDLVRAGRRDHVSTLILMAAQLRRLAESYGHGAEGAEIEMAARRRMSAYPG